VGDNGPAVNATLGYPEALTYDAQGNLYIADFAFARVRKITPAGTITTVAGNGVNGFSGDGGLARSAELSSPTGVAVDSFGNLYIADGPNARIRRVSPKGIITTFAGTGDFRILRPGQIAIDSKGNLYAVDGDQTNVRRIDPSGAITPVAGNGQMGFSGDGGPATAAMIVAIGVAVAVEKFEKSRRRESSRRSPTARGRPINSPVACCRLHQTGPFIWPTLRTNGW
jgi:sugar lactone lactonase YvrE